MWRPRGQRNSVQGSYTDYTKRPSIQYPKIGLALVNVFFLITLFVKVKMQKVSGWTLQVISIKSNDDTERLYTFRLLTHKNLLRPYRLNGIVYILYDCILYVRLWTNLTD